MGNEEEKHAAHRENFKVAFDLAGGYAKWLLSTLLLLNAGAIAVIFQRPLAYTYFWSLCFFGAGVLFALVSGMAGWFNLQYAASYHHSAAAEILAERSEPVRPKSIDRIRIGAIAATFLSIACLGLGAAFIAWTLR